MKVIRIGTRGSALALTQAAWVRKKLEERYPDRRVETVIIKTSGDRFLEASIQSIGGKGVFVKEIEEALLRNEIDLAVHSMKDLPTEISAALILAAIPEREDPRDVLVSVGRRSLKDLASGARIGTGSLRRRAQILHYRNDLEILPIRGNVDTRLKKLERGELEGVLMALAALRRMGWEERVSDYLSPEVCLSAVAQGALGLESRDDWIKEQVAFLHHPPTAVEVAGERAFLGRLGGGCHVPVGARAWTAGGEVRLMGVVADPDGRRLFRGEISGLAAETERLGRELAGRLLAEGAEEVLVPATGEGGQGA